MDAASMDFPALLDDLPVGVVVLDKDRRVLFLNKALEALTGFHRDEARGEIGRAHV